MVNIWGEVLVRSISCAFRRLSGGMELLSSSSHAVQANFPRATNGQHVTVQTKPASVPPHRNDYLGFNPIVAFCVWRTATIDSASLARSFWKFEHIKSRRLAPSQRLDLRKKLFA
jgi:hypothetical protein